MVDLAPQPLWVIKIGGSLLDLPDLQSRLTTWLANQPFKQYRLLLISGGGPTTDVIRRFDQIHQLGEEKSHWLALQALALNTAVLAQLLPDVQIVDHPDQVRHPGKMYLVDPYAYCRREEKYPQGPTFDPCWESGSDVLAGHLAIVGRAEGMILLKSTAIAPGIDLTQAIQQGLIDTRLESLLQAAEEEIKVQIVNMRANPPATISVAPRSGQPPREHGHSPTTPAKTPPNPHD